MGSILGKVYLVGAGPGDRGLITVKGCQCIKEADVIIYDRLVNKDLLKYRKNDCELIYVGKKSSNHILPQDDINETIAKKAEEGKVVVRLKGGDPFVFGRGGEEAEVLFDRGIDFEVVPGVTSAIGGLCYAGIPVTHRDFASSFHVVTGHAKKDDSLEINWSALAQEKGTVIFLMGIGNIVHIVDEMISHGRRPDTKVAFVSWASTNRQKKIITTLEKAVEVVKSKQIQAPALFVVGDVVSLSSKLGFFERKPMFNKKVIVTRTRSKNSEAREKLERLGAEVIEIPTISIETNYSISSDLVNIIKNKEYNAIAFTSYNSVNSFFDILKKEKMDIRSLMNLEVYSIGAMTSTVLEGYGIYDYIQSDTYTGESLANKINEVSAERNTVSKVIYPCSNIARRQFEDILKNKGNEVCRMEVYKNNIEEGYREELISALSSKEVDYITFTSSSTVENTLRLLGEENKKLLDFTKIISIGKITSKTVRENELCLYKESSKSSIDSMIDLIKEDIILEK